MKTINHEADHKHRWRCIGAHVLHAGHKPKGQNPYPEKRYPMRETRHVYVCMEEGCKAVKVSINHHMAFIHLQGGKYQLKQPRPIKYKIKPKKPWPKWREGKKT